MSTFIKPINGSSNKKGDNVLEYAGYNMQEILSPYDGVVTTTSYSSCGGNIKIKHNFNGSTIYSEFCGVNTILVSRGDNVSTGQKIGRFGSNPVEFSINDGFSNLSPSRFFGVSGEKPENKTTRNKGEETKPKSQNIKTYGDDTSTGAFKRTKGLTITHQVFADALAAPLNMFKGKSFFTPAKKSKMSDEERYAPPLKGKTWFTPANKNKTNENRNTEFQNLLKEEIEKIKRLF
jgi:hypothetical protein